MKGGEKMNETKKELKEQKFIESYINNGGNATGAYLAINPEVKKDSAGVLGLRMLKKVRIQLNDILDNIGLNNVYLANKLKDGIESKNLAIRIRYLDIVYKLKNLYPSEKHEMVIEEKPEVQELDAKLNKLSIDELKEIAYPNNKTKRKELNNAIWENTKRNYWWWNPL